MIKTNSRTSAARRLHVDSCSLGPVVNILAIFANANIIKNKRIKLNHINDIGRPLLNSINIVIFDQGMEK